MNRPTQYLRQQHFGRIGCVLIILLSLIASPKSVAAQPTATIVSLTGTVQAIFQSGEALIATTGLSLQAGDIVETQSGAEVVLEFSDGSQLQLSENTRLNLADLLENADTGARTSVIKLAWGKFRAILSPGHQEEGSAFSVETPNSLVGVKFSQPVITVGYDPDTDTTTIDAETVDVVLTNLRTQRTQLLLRGQRGVVRKDGISLGGGQKSSSSSQESQPRNQDGQAPLPENQPPVPPDTAPVNAPPSTSLPGGGQTAPPPESGLNPGQAQPPPPRQSVNRNAFVPAQRGIRAATGSTVPTSVGVVGVRQPGQPGAPGQPAGGEGPPQPGGLPQPGGGGIGGSSGPLAQPGARPESPENRQRRIIMIHLREQ